MIRENRSLAVFARRPSGGPAGLFGTLRPGRAHLAI
jgi:hypothetical protein